METSQKSLQYRSTLALSKLHQSIRLGTLNWLSRMMKNTQNICNGVHFCLFESFNSTKLSFKNKDTKGAVPFVPAACGMFPNAI
jgi:hypothetical protein